MTTTIAYPEQDTPRGQLRRDADAAVVVGPRAGAVPLAGESRGGVAIPDRDLALGADTDRARRPDARRSGTTNGTSTFSETTPTSLANGGPL
jgi:hypothetical protein